MNIDFNLTEIIPLRDKIATSIRDSIIDGRIKPGQKLSEIELSKKLGISRTPLREAFFQLESEGFLVVNPRKGATVSQLSPKDAEDIYVIKGSLEALAAELSLDFLTDIQIKEMTSLNNRMNNIAKAKKKDYKQFLILNAKFHQLLYESSRNEKLIRLIKSFRNQTLRYNFIYLSLLSHLEESVIEHTEMINAIQKKDKTKIEKALIKHSEGARKALHDYMQINNK